MVSNFLSLAFLVMLASIGPAHAAGKTYTACYTTCFSAMVPLGVIASSPEEAQAKSLLACTNNMGGYYTNETYLNCTDLPTTLDDAPSVVQNDVWACSADCLPVQPLGHRGATGVTQKQAESAAAGACDLGRLVHGVKPGSLQCQHVWSAKTLPAVRDEEPSSQIGLWSCTAKCMVPGDSKTVEGTSLVDAQAAALIACDNQGVGFFGTPDCKQLF